MNKKLEKKAKDIASRMTIEKKDVYNWKIKDDLSNEDFINAVRVIMNFITIPTGILNEDETKLFDENLFFKLKVSK